MTIRLLAILFALALSGDVVWGASSNGAGGTMPSYYDGSLFTINFKELPPVAEASVLASNRSLNTIYMCDSCEGALPGGASFVSVIDAIQGDGFNPLWQEVQITFTSGTPEQLTSDEDILAAADAGEIALMPTTEVYRCSVIGSRK